jgi:CSLREA domain-containing protein
VRCFLRVSVLLLVCAAPSLAATFTVDSTSDGVDKKPGDGACETRSGTCTLRAAVQEANARPGPAGIVLVPGTYSLTIGPAENPSAEAGDLDVLGELTISGGGAAKTFVDGGKLDRVLNIHHGARADISDLTVRNGKPADGRDGGGIFNGGHLTITDAVVSDNVAVAIPLSPGGRGGGIYSDGELRLNHVRLEHNRADSAGGGLINLGKAEVANSTVSENVSSTDKGGGIENRGGLNVVSSSISGNTAGDAGGGIDNTGGRIEVVDSTIDQNSSLRGGGILNLGTLMLTNVTLSGNAASDSGGGLWNGAASTVAMNNVTIASNDAASGGDAGRGGGICNDVGGRVTASNSILADNRDLDGTSPDCSGALISQGYDLVRNAAGCSIAGRGKGDLKGVDPRLDALASNGGPTRTRALREGSPAIDAGSPRRPGSGHGSCAKTDQRGVERPVDGKGTGRPRCDMGAYELRPGEHAGPRADVPEPQATPNPK